jgi:ADP-heptose:LPS heptosyltransferase
MKATPPRRILIVKLAEQGSTVLAYPALRRAVEIAGRENVYFLLFEENRFILELLQVIPRENIIALRAKNIFSLASNAVNAIRRLRKLELDSAIDMEFFARGSALLTFLSGAKNRAGFHSYFGAGPYRGDLMTHRLLYNPYLHTSQIFQLMVESLQIDPADLPTFGVHPPTVNSFLPQFSPGDDEVELVKNMIRAATNQPLCPPLILLNPNASDLLPLRRWPTERYVELARRILKHFPEIYIGMTGAPNETETIAKLTVQVGSPRCVSLAGKTTLRQLLVLYTLAKILVTNDSGPAHFASLTPIRVMTLFGPETPALFGARTSRNTAIWKGIACSPCVNAFNNRQSSCRNNLCMQQISVEEVFDETCKALEKCAAATELFKTA